jgi:hypothetical protein
VLTVPPDCFDIIQSALRVIPVAQRQRFLARLEENLRGHEIGAGIVGRACAEVQKQLLNAPAIDEPPRVPLTSRRTRRSPDD